MISVIMIISVGTAASHTETDAVNFPSQPGGESGPMAVYQTHLPFSAKYYFEPKLIVWHMWGGDYFVEYQEIVREFNLAHPELAVQLVFVGDIPATLASAIAAGEGPDIIAYPNDRVGEWAAADYLVPLDPWIDQAYLTGNFEPAAAQAVIWDDWIWGIPESQEGIALVYNKEKIGDAQLPAPDDFAGLLSLADAYQKAHPDEFYLCNQGLGNLDAYHVAPIYFGHGLDAYGGYVDEDGIAYLDTTEALNAANWISGFRPFAPLETSHEICRDMLVNGEAAIWWTGPWAIADLQNAGLDYGIAPMGNPFVSIKAYFLTESALDRGKTDAAIEFMKYMGSADVQKRLAIANHTVPANTAALLDPEVQAIVDVAQFGESMNAGIPMGNHIYSPCQWDPVGVATLAIWDGSQTPEEAMIAAQAAIETCIAGMGVP
jgi:arabinogalactan oligomer/maltooligosaccharide transport system substrate-binding protein